jgi:hypothetical protein
MEYTVFQHDNISWNSRETNFSVRCVTCISNFFATVLYFSTFVGVLFKQNKRKPYVEALRVFLSGCGLVPDPKPKNKLFFFKIRH